MTLLAQCHSPGSPHVLRCQHIHFAAGGCMENATRPVGTSFHWGTVKQIQKHCHMICFSTSVKYFNQNTRTKRRQRPQWLLPSFVTIIDSASVGGRCFPQTLKDQDGHIGKSQSGGCLQEQPWELQVNSWLSRRHVLIYTHTKWSGIPSNQRKPGLTQSRADIFIEQLVIWSKQIKHASMGLLSGGRLKFNSRDELNDCKKQDK